MGHIKKVTKILLDIHIQNHVMKMSHVQVCYRVSIFQKYFYG